MDDPWEGGLLTGDPPAHGLPTAPCFYLRFLKNIVFFCFLQEIYRKKDAGFQVFGTLGHPFAAERTLDCRTADVGFRMLCQPGAKGVIGEADGFVGTYMGYNRIGTCGDGGDTPGPAVSTTDCASTSMASSEKVSPRKRSGVASVRFRPRRFISARKPAKSA